MPFSSTPVTTVGNNYKNTVEDLLDAQFDGSEEEDDYAVATSATNLPSTTQSAEKKSVLMNAVAGFTEARNVVNSLLGVDIGDVKIPAEDLARFAARLGIRVSADAPSVHFGDNGTAISKSDAPSM